MQEIIPYLWFDNQAEEANWVTQAMLQMGKLEIDKLKQAYEGG